MARRLLHKLLLNAERAVERFLTPRRKRSGTAVIDPYLGFATPDNLILRGRVLSKLRHRDPRGGQGVWANLRDMVSFFLTDEIPDRRVWSGEVSAISDEEGYFHLLLPPALTPGWVEADVHVEGTEGPGRCRALVPRPDASFMVISDIDDTMMRTGAYSLAKNLWTTFTGNPLTRHIFPDARALMNSLSDGARNPVYYVSSSPWNMHDFLADVFRHSALVEGPMFLRDLGLSETQLITAGHGSHKGQSIDILLEANPDLPAILIGDSGQKDAAIYREAVERHPDRVAAVVIRTPGPGADEADLADFAALEATGVPLFTGADFEGMVPKLLAIFESGP